MGVQNSPELRAAHDAVQKDVVQASMRIAQSEPIYRALLALKRRGVGRARRAPSSASSSARSATPSSPA